MVEQVGGSHYKSEYQHWDWAVDIRLGYLESAATKYLARWKKKAGVVDLDKAISYMEKAQECAFTRKYKNRSHAVLDDKLYLKATEKFFQHNPDIDLKQKLLIMSCAEWKTVDDISIVIGRMRHYARTALGEGFVGVGSGQGQQGPTASAPGRPGRAGGGTNHPAPFGYSEDG